MIETLEIKNVALIDSATIEFGRGLNILSGETGSGKSVVIDALNFVLGAKADKSMIRHGEESCVVSAVFYISDNESIKSLLDEYEIEYDDQLVVTRKFTVEGKSSIRVNGTPCSSSNLKSMTAYLIDVHGQSEHYSLLKQSEQLKVVDKFCQSQLEPVKEQVVELVAKLKEIDRQLQKFGGNDGERAIRADILKFQIDEISSVDEKEGEEDELIAYRRKIQSAEKLAEAFSSSYRSLSGENGAIDRINAAIKSLGNIINVDDAYFALQERLKAVKAEVDDVAEIISDYSGEIDFDESKADEIESRLDKIKALRKKYGVSFEAVQNFLSNAKDEYTRLVNYDEEYSKLSVEKQKLLVEYNRKNSQISVIRRKFSKELCLKVTEQLTLLGMKNAKFDASFSDEKEVVDAPYPTNGNDEVSFEFSANLGEPLKPLSKIISGGEMSRFMLALKSIISEYQDLSTYVFDEIDVGISGSTAETVAKKFADIAKNVQVIAISHLPQVCAMGDASLKIAKVEKDGKTYTVVKRLNQDEKVLELVRIMSGDLLSQTAKLHAEEMVATCDKYKSTL